MQRLRVFRGYHSGIRRIDKVLIANRGEIAIRVARTAKAMGKKVVAVYSDADALSAHVEMADEAYNIGPAASAESYLRSDVILQVARKAKAQAIHPGYGFLSENATFAEQCEQAGIIFIGPPPSAIRAMGCKRESKILMQKAGVPVVPGYHGENQEVPFLKAEAAKIGFPLLIKATMGGGGKGMRVVHDLSQFEDCLSAAKREAKSSFGDETVLLERFIVQPRHIEVQVFGDTHGNAVHLFERDCSVQRRHQKVLEESPAPGVTPQFRTAIGTAAVNAAKAVGYVGAGTCEFVVGKDLTFFFMEMNTRLQVEHPVTEMVTRQDLVEWQLRVAAGEPLPVTQDQLSLHGHAFETRIYAEAPEKNFLPGSGTVEQLQFPSGPYIRVDTGVRPGDNVGVFYDPMIAKLIVWGQDRQQALHNTSAALKQLLLTGLPSNVNFLQSVIDHPEFQKGGVDTGFIAKHHDELFPSCKNVLTDALTFAATAFCLHQDALELVNQESSADPLSPWSTLRGFAVNAKGVRSFELAHEPANLKVVVENNWNGSFTVSVGKESREIKAELNGTHLRAVIGQQTHIAEFFSHKNHINLWHNGHMTTYTTVITDPALEASESSGGTLSAPMSGKIIKIEVGAGNVVKKGQAVIVMEAMKMEHTLTAPINGKLDAVFCKVGDVVPDAKKLAVILPE